MKTSYIRLAGLAVALFSAGAIAPTAKAQTQIPSIEKAAAPPPTAVSKLITAGGYAPGFGLAVGEADGPSTFIGTVRTQTGAPIEGAIVTVMELGLEVMTDPSGSYRLPIEEARVSGKVATLRAQAAGYKGQTFIVSLVPGAQAHQFSLAKIQYPTRGN